MNLLKVKSLFDSLVVLSFFFIKDFINRENCFEDFVGILNAF